MILPEYEANRMLAEAGIPVIPLSVVNSPEEALNAAARVGFPVVVKLSSSKYTHKSEIGGVRVNLKTDDDVAAAFGHMDGLRRELDSSALIILEPMVPAAAELFVGFQRHDQFGAVISIGLGGTLLELTSDVAFRLLPARKVDFREMLGELKSWAKLKKGFRNFPAADEEGVVNLLERVSDFVLSRPDLLELDLNPVILQADGARAVDARIVLAP